VVEPVATPSPPAPIAQKGRRRTWDVLLTAALLLIGVYDVAATLPQFLNLAPVLREVFAQQGVGDFTSNAAAAQAGLVIAIGRAILLVITIVVALVLLARNRVAFWVPLVGGAIGLLLIIIAVTVVLVGDPAFVKYAMPAGG
jgi:hypothetical protein